MTGEVPSFLLDTYKHAHNNYSKLLPVIMAKSTERERLPDV